MKEFCMEYLANKAEIDRLTKRNKEIAERLDQSAMFKEGAMTGHVAVDGYKVTLTHRVNTTWDQKGLDAVRQLAGDEEFSIAFTYKFEPRSKADLDAYVRMASPQIVQAIAAAKTDKPGSTSCEIKEA